MKQESGKTPYREIVEYEKRSERECHHRGKSSQCLLDKDAILGALEIRAGQVILDGGCGNGYMAKEFSLRVGKAGQVYALDLDETAIAALRQESAGTNMVPLVGDLTTTIALPASAFDLVYLSTVVHGFSPEQFKSFEAEVKRLLAAQGRLAIVEIVKRETPFGPPLNRRFSPEELRHALALPALTTMEIGEYFYLQLFGRG